jgi:hypothetical protein
MHKHELTSAKIKKHKYTSAKNRGARKKSANAKARNLRPKKECESARSKSFPQEHESASAKPKKKRVPSSAHSQKDHTGEERAPRRGQEARGNQENEKMTERRRERDEEIRRAVPLTLVIL